MISPVKKTFQRLAKVFGGRAGPGLRCCPHLKPHETLFPCRPVPSACRCCCLSPCPPSRTATASGRRWPGPAPSPRPSSRCAGSIPRWMPPCSPVSMAGRVSIPPGSGWRWPPAWLWPRSAGRPGRDLWNQADQGCEQLAYRKLDECYFSNTNKLDGTNHPTFLSHDILTSFNKSGCRSNTFSSFTKAKGGLVFPFS